MVENLSADLIEMLMNRYQWDMKKSLDVYYGSDTFKKVCDEETGLYFQGPVYVFSFLENEIEKGKMA